MRSLILAAILLAANGAASAEPLDPKAEEVIARARTTESMYTIFWRVRIANPSSKPEYAWAATFRQGSFVRVEDLSGRAVADCSAGTGTQYDLSIGRDDYLHGSKVAKRYCGIDEDRKVLSARWLGQKESKFGLVDEVQIVDKDGTDTYQVTAAGAVVGVMTTYRGSNVVGVAEPMSFELGVPAGDLFSKRSLGTSKVPKVVQSRGSRPER